MKCDLCNKEATVFLTNISNGEMTKHSYCQECADEQGATDPLKLAMQNDLSAKLGDDAPSSAPFDDEDEDAELAHILEDALHSTGSTCEECGFTLADLKRIGRLGCPECYNIFRAEVLPNLSKMHVGTTHVGSAPTGMRENLARAAAIDKLQSELDSAIASEDYERAAELRDAISREKDHAPQD